MDALPLNDREIDRVSEFVHALHQWVTEKPDDPGAIRKLAKQYENIVGLLGKTTIVPEDIIEAIDYSAYAPCAFAELVHIRKVNPDFAKDRMTQYKEREEEPLLTPSGFENTLRVFDGLREPGPAATSSFVSLEDIRDRVKKELESKVDFDHEMALKEADPVLGKFGDVCGRLDSATVGAVGRSLNEGRITMEEVSTVIKNRDRTNAQNILAAAIVLDATGAREKPSVEARLKKEIRYTGAALPSIEAATGRLDRVLADAELDDAARKKIMGNLRTIITEMGGQKGRHLN